MPESDASNLLLRMRNVKKSFPGVQALRGVSLKLHAGEVLAVLGENGAGKSTLMKVLGGAHVADFGTMEIEIRGDVSRSDRSATRTLQRKL